MLIDFDKVVNKSHKTKYKNRSPLWPQHPFRCIIVGSSSSGKTSGALNIIHNSVFHHIYLYCKTAEDKYEWLVDEQLKKEKELRGQGINEKLVTYSNNIDDVVDVDSLDETKQNLVIFDDFCLEANKVQREKISDFFIRSRKFNCSVLYISQSFFSIPKIIRLNSNYCALHAINDKRELKTIHNIYLSDIPFNEFNEKYNMAIASYSNHGCLLIDTIIPHKQLRLRANYSDIFHN